MGEKNKIWRIKGALTCRQGEGHQVGEEVAGEVALALVQRGGHLAADLLRQLGTHHGRDALGRLLGHLLRTAGGPGGKRIRRLGATAKQGEKQCVVFRVYFSLDIFIS